MGPMTAFTRAHFFENVIDIVLSKKQKENLQIFEKECMNEYLHSLKAANATEIGHRVQHIHER